MSKYLILWVSLSIITACNINNQLSQEPTELLTNKDIWNSNERIVSLLANYYDRLPKHEGLETPQSRNMAAYTDAIWSGEAEYENLNNITAYDYARWRLWDYDLIRDINLAIENIDKYSTKLKEAEKTHFKAELRFLRAYMYFELVKRMGGIPIITETKGYNSGEDVNSLQVPRNTEAEVYDFISSEINAIIDKLGNEGSQTRANKWTALALKSRAMLYAGSLAKYNNQMNNPITLPGDEVGISASKANDYYQQSLAASQRILQNSPYSLYKNNSDLGKNFYEAITKKENNSEVMWVDDYQKPDETNNFTYRNIARAVREDNLNSSSITPSLNLVESFEYRNGKPGELQTSTTDGDYIYYDSIEDIFDNKDARLYGTVVYPGSTFRELPVDIQAGVKRWDSDTQSYETIESDQLGSTYEDGGVLTGSGGPMRTARWVSNTGFYLRKYVSDKQGSSERQQSNDVWWIYFRLGEIYLNEAEAAYELGNNAEALRDINKLRERAGFGSNSLTSIDMDKIRHERRVELAFEDHRVWDLKRWRIAHKVWNGQQNNPQANVYALYPYRVVRPGNPKNGKYVFDKIEAPRFENPRYFRMGNYYSSISAMVLNNNPKIVKNPFH